MSGATGWTTPAQLRAQVAKLWDRGDLGRAVISAALVGEAGGETAGGDSGGPGDGLAETVFPLRLSLRTPTSGELTERFDQARAWSDGLDAVTGVRIERRRVKHRVLGANDLPTRAWIDSLDEAIAVAGRAAEAATLGRLAEATAERRPELITWLRRRPAVALECAAGWGPLLEVVNWIEAHPKPGVYLRQVDLPGVDTKLIESHRRVLSELIDLGVPAAVVEPEATGVRGFERRYGFRSKPTTVRFRILDRFRSRDALGPFAWPADVTVDAVTFARLDPEIDTVFLVENEVNFLAFPEVANAMVVWVAGFGTERLAAADWLAERTLRYWGDIDTHGFAILDELRRRLPDVESFLMDRRTLIDHRSQWVTEPHQETRHLPRLTADESALYDDLRNDQLGRQIRLEQERVRYGHVQAAVQWQQRRASIRDSGHL